jgi:hypothetical protein
MGSVCRRTGPALSPCATFRPLGQALVDSSPELRSSPRGRSGDAPAAHFKCQPSACPAPPPPALPDEIRIRYGPHLTNGLSCSQKGIEVSDSRSGSASFYPWAAVEYLRITCYRHACPLELRLELGLAGRKKPIRFGRGLIRWTGPDDEQVMRYFREHVPAERVELTAREGPARGVAEATRRLAKLDRDERKNRLGIRSILMVYFLLIAFLIFYKDANPLHWDWMHWLEAGLFLLMNSAMPLMVLSVSSVGYKRTQAKRADLAGWLSLRSL